MLNYKFKIAMKGSLKEVKEYFDLTYKGETFKSAFHQHKNIKNLKVSTRISSYDYLYSLYRSPDLSFVLIELYCH